MYTRDLAERGKQDSTFLVIIYTEMIEMTQRVLVEDVLSSQKRVSL